MPQHHLDLSPTKQLRPRLFLSSLCCLEFRINLSNSNPLQSSQPPPARHQTCTQSIGLTTSATCHASTANRQQATPSWRYKPLHVRSGEADWPISFSMTRSLAAQAARSDAHARVEGLHAVVDQSGRVGLPPRPVVHFQSTGFAQQTGLGWPLPCDLMPCALQHCGHGPSWCLALRNFCGRHRRFHRFSLDGRTIHAPRVPSRCMCACPTETAAAATRSLVGPSSRHPP